MDILYNILKYINKKMILHKIKKNDYNYFTITRGKEKIVVINKKCYTIA